MNLKHLTKIEKPADLEKLRPLFQDIRFYIGTSILDGTTGSAYTDDPNAPRFGLLAMKDFCFLSGQIDPARLEEILLSFKKITLVPDDRTGQIIQALFDQKLTISQRHSFYKDPSFDREKLKQYVSRLPDTYQLVEINQALADQINADNFLRVTPNFAERGVGCCCMYEGKIIGIASSNVVYREGIEVNLRVDRTFQGQGLATALSAHLVLMCLDRNIPISWDAMNLTSVSIAKKLGFQYCRPYTTYKITE